MQEPVIEVKNLRKEYKNFTAVNGISFTLYQGDVLGFLGPNGAGKSTTLRMITSLIQPTSGEVFLFNNPLTKNRIEVMKRIGAIVERPDVYGFLSAYKNLELFAKLSYADTSKKHLMETLELVGLAERADSKAKTFSHGMKQRLGIATALVHNPDVVILDEPTTGLDPQGMKDIRDIIDHLAKVKGKTVMLSSHILPEVEMSANRMVIINRGNIVVEGDVASLLASDTMSVEIKTTEPERLLALIDGTGWKTKYTKHEAGSVFFSLMKDEIPPLVKFINEYDIPIMAVIPTRSLEEYFLNMVAQAESDNHTIKKKK
jgi:ABC-type multidrug transport system ATPase subunit